VALIKPETLFTRENPCVGQLPGKIIAAGNRQWGRVQLRSKSSRTLAGTVTGRAITARGQNFSSDALFTPKMDIFKTLEIFLSARESLSIQTSISRSVRNQSSFHGS